jgi:hypothetical protein
MQRSIDDHKLFSSLVKKSLCVESENTRQERTLHMHGHMHILSYKAPTPKFPQLLSLINFSFLFDGGLVVFCGGVLAETGNDDSSAFSSSVGSELLINFPSSIRFVALFSVLGEASVFCATFKQAQLLSFDNPRILFCCVLVRVFSTVRRRQRGGKLESYIYLQFCDTANTMKRKADKTIDGPLLTTYRVVSMGCCYKEKCFFPDCKFDF